MPGHSIVKENMTNAFFDLTGKIILITGAAGHLGAAISERLYEAGAIVCVNGRSREKLEVLADGLGDRNRVEILDFDIADQDAVEKAVAHIKTKFGRLDGLVNNAFTPLSGSVDTATFDDFQKCFSVNVSAAFSLTQKCFPLLQRSKEQTHSAIVNIASMYGMVSPDPSIYGDTGMNNPPFYGASKAAIIQLTKYFATHIADKGIRTNAVSPGPFPPQSVADKMPEFHAELCKKNPLKRIGNPVEVAAAVHFLLSDDASYINGLNLPVDGGWTAW